MDQEQSKIYPVMKGKDFPVVTINDEEVSTYVDIATLEFLAEITGKDPFEWEYQTGSLDAITTSTETVVHALMRRKNQILVRSFDFSAEDVREWVKLLTPAEVVQIRKGFAKSCGQDLAE